MAQAPGSGLGYLGPMKLGLELTLVQVGGLALSFPGSSSLNTHSPGIL